VIVTSFAPIRVTDELWVNDGRVAARGRGRRIDAGGDLVIPGLVCAHTHLYSALARGMPYRLEPPTGFVEILQRIWWRLDRALDLDSVRASALAGGMEALLSGTTTLVDHHASPNAVDGSLDVIAEALGSLGARSVLCYETSDRDGPATAEAGLAENRRFVERVRRERPRLVRALVGAHASFTLSDETLGACAAVARELGAGLHIHVAEDRADEEDAVAREGMRVVERLERLEALDDRALLAHGVHLDEHELALVASAGSRVAHNARSNMNNSIGRAAVEELGARVALGTDGIGADMFEESRTAYFRLREDDANADATWPLERLAESARIAAELFDEPLLGTLEPGAPADLAVLDYPAPTPLDASTFAGHWVFALSSRHVRDVMVGGEWVVRDRRVVRADQDAIATAATAQARRLWQRLDVTPPHPFTPKGAVAWTV